MNFSYLIVCAALFIGSYIVTDIVLRIRKRKFINVEVIGKDGSRKIVTLRTTRDPEVAELIRKVKEEQKAAH